ncbi:Phenylacetate-coenzyme A ligase [termite gut metagenome]|uniref:Phenylacetate-coenzyme A ligase n=1 Tax=termite gut metagenome TaxID=433724 RepID=A0A5J4SDL5_9ZZZZ
MNTSSYWQEEVETMSREGLRELQLQRFKKTFSIVANAPYYKNKFREYGVTADVIHSIEDISQFPFTVKADMREQYPFGLVAGDMKDAVRLHSSSGTTGNPTVIVHSQHDLDSWANLVARCLYMVGLRNTDVFQNSSGYGMFTGGLGFQYGAERLGALTVPAAAGNSKRQIKFITDFGTTALHAIPSYAIRLAEVFQEEGIDPTSTHLFYLHGEDIDPFYNEHIISTPFDAIYADMGTSARAFSGEDTSQIARAITNERHHITVESR